jgi:histidine ammonia-lyase
MFTVLDTLSSDNTLTLSMLERAAHPIEVLVTDETTAKVERGHAFVQKILVEDGRPVYGATTGFGPLVDFHGRLAQEDQCDNVLQHLTAGQGHDLPLPVVRAAMLVRVWSLSRGLSGISPTAIEALRAALGTSFTPATWYPWRTSRRACGGSVMPMSTACGCPRRGR